MKNKLKFIVISIVVILFTAILSFIIISSLKIEEKYIGKLEDIYEYQKFGNCYEFSVEGQMDINLEGKDDLWKPITSGGEEVYCIQPGTPLGPSTYTRDQIFQWANWKNSIKHGRSCVGDCPYLNRSSKTYYKCSGRHYTESSSYYNSNRKIKCDNLYDVGYIVSYYMNPGDTNDTWAGGKQQAVWMSPICEKEDPNRGNFRASGEQLRKESLEYQEFYQKIVENENKIMVQDKTVKEYVKIDTNQTKKTHTMGPFKIDYINGNYPSHAYGGISDMYLLDENGKKIEITKLLRPQNMAKLQPSTVYTPYSKPDFFSNYEPSIKGDNPNCIDYHSYSRNYPAPNEEFYVEFNYTGDVTSYLKLHIEFKYLVCHAEICLRTGERWAILEQGCSHSNHCHGHSLPSGGTTYCSGCCHACEKWAKGPVDIGAQDGVYVLPTTYRELVKSEYEIEVENLATTKMKIGGFVFEDLKAGKEQVANGLLDSNRDIRLENIQVTLIDASTNQLATLATLKEENPKATESQVNDKDDYLRRINPTLTDKNGYYEFRGVNPEKKYYIQFTYNGQTYTCTDYLKDTGCNNITEMIRKNYYESIAINEKWRYTSKGTEDKTERNSYNNKFGSIGSSPNNYSIVNSKVKLITGNYNETFTTYELSGITLNSQGKYEYNHNKQLVDTYLIVENGVIIDTSDVNYINDGGTPKLTEGLITEKIKDYIRVNHKYPTDMKNQIYNQIAHDQETWKKLQYIEDCKINSYTKSVNAVASKDISNNYDKYPVYDKFTTYVKSGNQYPDNSYSTLSNYKTYSDKVSIYDNHSVQPNLYNSNTKEEYKNIYPGQLFINQGLVARPKADIIINKDVFKATLKVKDKIESYTYDRRELPITQSELNELDRLWEKYDKDRSNKDNENAYSNYYNSLIEKYEKEYWKIQTRIVNYDKYYGDNLNRELYESDLYYEGTNNLEVYITYRITVTNNSQSVVTRINEIADYYDDDYKFIPEKSWVMYVDTYENNNANDYITVKGQEFYDIMAGKLKTGTDTELEDKSKIKKYKEITEYIDMADSKNKKRSNADFNEEFSRKGYKTVYIQQTKNKKLQSGEELYLYLTFKINGEGGKNPNILIEESDKEDGKQNIIEINGYSTYYENNTKLPNNITIKGDDTVAGIIDHNSSPGNFKPEDLEPDENGRYEHHFEPDTDRSRSVAVFVDRDNKRTISGTVWEDKRDTEVQDAIIGNGIRDEDEIKISNIGVELREVELENGKPKVENGEIVTKTAQIYNNSSKSFEDAVTRTENGEYSFEGVVPGDYIVRFTYGEKYNAKYNGQDYKSTSYQVGIEQDNGTRTDVAKENGYYGYSVTGDYNDDNRGQNTSGSYGYDIYKTDNHKSNVSDAKDLWEDRMKVNNYSSNNGNGVTHNLADKLNKNTEGNLNTQMIAETGVIRFEFEYNREDSNANGISNEGNKNNPDAAPTTAPSYQGQNGDDNNTYNGYYHIENVDLGLEERPKAQLELNKKVSNVKIVLANQNVLFDANGQMNNLLWNPKTAYNILEKRENKLYKYYGDNTYDDFREGIRGHINTLINKYRGLIQVTMDEELMHGATIEITYDMTVTNCGEVDYKDTQFYYQGINKGVSDTETIVKTSAVDVIDYVSNNLQFRETLEANKNGKWKAIDKDTAKNNYELTFMVDNNGDGINEANITDDTLNKYNTIIHTNGLKNELVPNALSDDKMSSEPRQTQTKLVLSKLITSQNTDDDRCYDNVSEIVKISNDVGRRMAYSVQGNQNPNIEGIYDGSIKMEADSSIAEEVKILPPFGIGNIVVYIALTIAVLTILITGIIIIKKKVLK